MILSMLWDAAVHSRAGSLARHRSQDETRGGSGIRKKFRVTGGVVHNASTCELSNSASAFVLCICSYSTRTRIALRPCCFNSSAFSDEKTISPVAAPGEAGRPTPMTWRSAAGSMVGCRS